MCRQKGDLRQLAGLIRRAKTTAVRRRLRVAYLFQQGRLPAQRIAQRARVSRATAFAYWRCYRTAGVQGLLQMRPVGRPCGMPAVVRQRFDYLNRPNPFSPPGEPRPFVYITQRELAVFRALGKRYQASQISRWLRQYISEKRLRRSLRRFRVLRRGYRHLAWDDRLGGFELSCPGLNWRQRMRAEVLFYAGMVYPDKRELHRRALAICFSITPAKVAFNDEPDQHAATVVWAPPLSIETELRMARELAVLTGKVV